MSSTYRSMRFAASSDLTSCALPTMPRSGPGWDLRSATLAAGSPGSKIEFCHGNGSERVLETTYLVALFRYGVNGLSVCCGQYP